MELFIFCKATAFFLILHFFFSLSAHAASDQARYFINCGSSANTTNSDGQTFVGDIKPEGFYLCSKSKTVKDSNPSHSTSNLYQSARVFTKPSAYVFDIQQTGTYILRLHFYAFKSLPKLAQAQFDVSASGHELLSDFGVGSSAADSPVHKEFLIKISTSGEFQVHFVPNHSSSSLAFINAMELLSTNLNITELSDPNVSPTGSLGLFRGQSFDALETLYRINVGGQRVIDGTLWRTWVPDDQYLISKNAAKNYTNSAGVIFLNGTPSDEDYAPLQVYQSAKVSSANLNSRVVSNVTWQFNVSRDTNLFIRLHFCDIYSASLTDHRFNLYLYEKFVKEINPYYIVGELGTPFFKDYVVETMNLEFINISIGPLIGRYLFLNGLEIMQVKNGTAPDPPLCKASKVKLIIFWVGASIALLVVMLAVAVLLRHKKRKRKPTEVFEWAMVALYGATSSHNKASEKSSSHASNLSNLHLRLKIPFVEVQQVTNNFDADLIIGQGGFGKVYKGTLKNGDKVAVKRSDPNHGQGIAEFQTEIMVLSKIRHRHLVSLIGYCYEYSEMILVYEFMEKGTLRDHLYDVKVCKISGSSMWLSWNQRLEICIGAAKGLHYLHTDAGRNIIHRDVKSTNILLDERYVAKVADFGLSRLGHLEQTHVSTDIKGTFGYLDPEYFRCMQLTDKSDVYSFGVVLLEVLCARAVIDRSLPEEQVNLADWIMACYAEGKLEETIDPSLVGSMSQNSLKKFIETAAKCLKDYAAERPAMSDVLWDLEYALQLQKEETQRGMQGDSITDASLSLPFPADPRFSSQSFTDVTQDDLINYTTSGEVFSQMGFNDAAR